MPDVCLQNVCPAHGKACGTIGQVVPPHSPEAVIEAHATAAAKIEIEADLVQTELADLFSPVNEMPALEPPAKTSVFPGAMRVWFRRSATVLLWLLGVALPLGVLALELLAGFCAETLFDPIPTGLHALLIALVPIANAWALLAARPQHKSERSFRIAGRLNGLALGISAYYALQFAIVTPFAFIALIYFVFVFSLSRYGGFLERRMAVGEL